MGNFVEVKNLIKIFPGGLKAVDNVSFEVQKGKFLTLLGPSGCGKTTTLRCVAGLEIPDGGEIIVDGQVYNSATKRTRIPPDKRDIGMVFQSYAVWPHMNVFDNVAYGLKMNKVAKAEIKQRVKDVLELVGLHGLASRPVTKLSGGQQQRVAVARALVYNPKLLLFDEPLSNLDAKLRENMRLELINLQREIGITSLYVTHDQAEAMVISDEIIVMRDGRIEQIGNAEQIYNMPANKFVADFIGIANFLEGRVQQKRGKDGIYGTAEISDGTRNYDMRCVMSDEAKEGDPVVLFFRPENTKITQGQKGKADEMNIFKGKVSNLIYLGNYKDGRIMVGTSELRMQISPEEKIKVNDEVQIEVDPKNCIAYAMKN